VGYQKLLITHIITTKRLSKVLEKTSYNI